MTHGSLLSLAQDELARFADGRSIVAAAQALRALVAWGLSTAPALPEDSTDVSQITQRIRASTPDLADLLGHRLPRGHVDHCAACAAEMLTCEDEGRRIELLTIVAFLQVECQARALADFVARSSDPLARAMVQREEFPQSRLMH